MQTELSGGGVLGPPAQTPSRPVTVLPRAGPCYSHPSVLGFSPHCELSVLHRLILVQAHHAPTSGSPGQLMGRGQERQDVLGISNETWIPAFSSLPSGPCLGVRGAVSIYCILVKMTLESGFFN